jgi:hypothetical protein
MLGRRAMTGAMRGVLAAAAAGLCDCSFTTSLDGLSEGCPPGLSSCDGDAANGCETDPRSDIANCGGCALACASSPNSDPVCTKGACALLCDAGFADCNGEIDDGCESEPATDAAHCGACNHGCQGGECAGGRCQPITIWSGPIEDPPLHATGITVGPDGVYWCLSGAIMAANLDGSGSAQLAPALGPLRITTDGSFVYWSNADGNVMKVPTSGGPSTVIAPADGRDLRAAGGFVYYVDVSGVAGSRRISRARAEGGEVLDLATGEGNPWGLAIDATYVYWTGDSDGSIKRAPLDGSGPTTLLASGFGGSYSIAVAAQTVFWSADSIGQVPAGGGPASALAPDQAQGSVAADETFVYWTGFDDRSIKKAPVGGGEPVTLATIEGGPDVIALSETAIYWTVYDGPAVMKLAK